MTKAQIEAPTDDPSTTDLTDEELDAWIDEQITKDREERSGTYLDDVINTLNFECSCTAWMDPDPDEHDWSVCDLFDSVAFSDGLAFWDPVSRQLVLENGWDQVVEDYESVSYDENPNEIILAEMAAEKGGDDMKNSILKMWDAAASKGAVTSYPNSAYGASAFVEKCRHFDVQFPLPDGTIVWPSSSFWGERKGNTPDLGIYLDGCWDPDTIAFHIGWRDYGLPLVADWQLMHIAEEGLRIARDDGMVEIGCIGGHGRTGTMLAILCLMTDENMTPDQAKKYVWDNYCDKAIESAKQEWYVEKIHAIIHDLPIPEMPVPPPPPPKPAGSVSKVWDAKAGKMVEKTVEQLSISNSQTEQYHAWLDKIWPDAFTPAPANYLTLEQWVKAGRPFETTPSATIEEVVTVEKLKRGSKRGKDKGNGYV